MFTTPTTGGEVRLLPGSAAGRVRRRGGFGEGGGGEEEAQSESQRHRKSESGEKNFHRNCDSSKTIR